MSIISEALKKARENKIEVARPAPDVPASESPKKTSSDGRWRLIVVIVMILIGTPLLVEFLSPSALKRAAGQRPASSDSGRAQFAVEERPVFFGSKKPRFSLSGIAQFQDSYMAVINGHILKQGDSVQGAKVVGIRPDAVELDYKGERIVLEKTF
jgi:hypothetical protein